MLEIMKHGYNYLDNCTPNYKNIISESGCGNIYNTNENNKIVIKIAKNGLSESETNKHILRKINKHPNLLTIYGFEKIGCLNKIYMEKLIGCDLYTYYYRYPEYINFAYIIKNIICGLKFLHNNNIIHRDIKPENIYILYKDPSNIKIKIIDFGLSYYGKEASGLYGTSGFYAPEMIFDKYYNNKCDIWSLGCIVYWLLSNNNIFNNCLKHEYKLIIQKKTKINFKFECNNKYKQMCKNMLIYDPKKRWSIKKCYKKLNLN